MKSSIFVAFGAVFGFFLSRARATDFDAIVGMFRLTELRLFGVIGVAIATAALTIALARRLGLIASIAPKPMSRSVFTGGLVFGVGWALCGACPGGAMTQLGEGKLYALATTLGILAGTWTWRVVSKRSTAPAPRGAHAGAS